MKKLFFLLFVSAVCFQTFAIPAYPYPVTVTQPNGEEVTLIVKGDEFINWAVTLDNYTLLINSDFYFCYAQINSSGDLEPSSYAATEISNRSPEVNAWLQNINTDLFYSEEQVFNFMQLREIAQVEGEQNRAATTGVYKFLVILMEFPDRHFRRSVDDFDMLFNQVNYFEGEITGSMRDYYFAASYNKLEIQTTIVGPYITNNNASYYVPETRWSLFAREAATAAVNNGVDLSEFATGNQVPNIYVIYAGYDASAGCSDCIWAHAQASFNYNVGGYLIQRYACSSELRGTSGSQLSDIGVLCHEFGHTLGTPDFYDVDYNNNGNGEYDGTGKWDIMAGGSWNNGGTTPPFHNPRSKIDVYGWAQATVLNTPQKVTVPLSRIYQNAYFRIDIPNSDSYCTQQYFMIENKDRGSFDTYIPGQNLLIYRCTENYQQGGTGGMYNANTTSWQRYYPVTANAPIAVPEAGTNKQSQYGSINAASATWPGTGNKTTFNNTTTPAMVSWGGTPTNKPITNIQVYDDYITFNFMGGGSKSNYIVFLPAYYGCTVTAQTGSSSPVDAGGSFSFKVDLLPSHSKSNIVVTANGTTLTPSGNVYTITNIQEDQIVRIEGLEFTTFPVSVSAGENGTIIPNNSDGIVPVNYGGMQTFEIRPDNGCSVDNVKIDGVDKGNIKSYTFKNVLEPHTINATFKLGGIYTINVDPDVAVFETETGTPSDSVIFTITSPDITSSISVVAPPNFEISLNGIKWYSQFSIGTSQLPAKLYVRFSPPAGSSPGTINTIIPLRATEAYAEIKLTGTALGVNDLDNNKNILLHPNPTKGELIIESGELKIENVEIYDIYGRKLYLSTRPLVHSSTVNIDISHLNAGIYMIAIQTDKGIVYKKVVKE